MSRCKALPVVLLLLLLPLAACETDQPTPEERATLEPLVTDFLQKLAQSYREMDTAPLDGIAAPRMIDRVRHDIELLKSGGDRLDPVMKSVEITRLLVIRHANAYVNATETWDTKRFDAFSGELIGHNPDSVLHSHIQIKLMDGKWMVLYREVEETATGPRFVVPTEPAD